MEKIFKMINVKFLMALLILLALFNHGIGIVIAIIALVISEDEWTKKVAMRLLATIFLFYILALGISALEYVIQLLENLISVSDEVIKGAEVASIALVLLEDIYMGFMALKAYKGEFFSIGLVEKQVIFMENYSTRNSEEKVVNNDNYDKVAYCDKCGTGLNGNERFCRNCGNKVN